MTIEKKFDITPLMQILERVSEKICQYSTSMLHDIETSHIDFLFNEPIAPENEIIRAAKLAYYYLQIKTDSYSEIEKRFIAKLHLKLKEDKELAANVIGFVLIFTGDAPFTEQPEKYNEAKIPCTNLGEAKRELLNFLLNNNAIGLTTTFMGLPLIELPHLGAYYIIEPNMNQWRNLPRKIKSHPYTEDFITQVQNIFSKKLNDIIKANQRLALFKDGQSIDTSPHTSKDFEEDALSAITYNEHLITDISQTLTLTFGYLKDEILSFIINGAEPRVISFYELGQKYQIPYPKDEPLPMKIIWLKQVNDQMIKNEHPTIATNIHCTRSKK